MVLWGPRAHIFWKPFQFLKVKGYFSWILINKHKMTINSSLVKDSEPNDHLEDSTVQLTLYVVLDNCIHFNFINIENEDLLQSSLESSWDK